MVRERLIIDAKSLDDAEKIAASNPFIASIRVYEMMEMKPKS